MGRRKRCGKDDEEWKMKTGGRDGHGENDEDEEGRWIRRQEEVGDDGDSLEDVTLLLGVNGLTKAKKVIAGDDDGGAGKDEGRDVLRRSRELDGAGVFFLGLASADVHLLVGRVHRACVQKAERSTPFCAVMPSRLNPFMPNKRVLPFLK